MASIAFTNTGAAAERPAFEVASVRLIAPGTPAPPDGSDGFRVSPDGVAWRYTKLVFCLAWAYDIPGRVNGPDWIFQDHYAIAAKAGRPVPESQLKTMMQALLENRFKLRVHLSTSELAVAVLTVAKNGAKNLAPGEGSNYEAADGRLRFEGSMADFARLLGNSPPYGVREKVVDQTGLAGVFKIWLDVRGFDVNDPSFEGRRDDALSAAFAFVSSALEKQYGLRLEHRKVPLESLVVDSGNRVPAEN